MAFRLLFWQAPRIGVIELHGLLAPRPGALNIGSMVPLIDRAFRVHAGAGDLDIDSPGGSPVQSDLIAARIRRRADEAGKVHAVIQEVGASGGYWLACAADEIHANPMSIVGSIGVRGGGFGFPDVIARLGVERRMRTAGVNKARLDPFARNGRRTSCSCRRCWMICTCVSRTGCGRGGGKNCRRTRRGVRRRIYAGRARAGARVDRRVRRLGWPGAGVGGQARQAHVFRPRKRGLLSRLPRLAVDAVLDAAEETTRAGGFVG